MDGGGKAERFALNETLRGLTKTKDFPFRQKDGEESLGRLRPKIFPLVDLELWEPAS